MRRLVVATVLGIFAMLGTVPGAGAQIPPIDDATDALEETVEETVEAVEGTLGGATEAVGGATEAVGGTGGGGTSAAEQGAEGTAGSVIGSATGSTGGAAATSGEASGDQTAGSTSGTADETRQRGHAAPRSQRGPNGSETRVVSVRVAAADHGSASGAAAATYVPLLVRLTNDADSDGSYSDVEAAPVPDGDVPFQVRLENTGPNAVAILAIRNASAALEGRDSAVCGNLPGIQLAPGQSTACRFTAKAIAPPQGERAVTVVEVDAADTADPTTTGTVTDTTVIRTENGSVLGLFVRRGLDFLATTGARMASLLAATMALAVSGVLLITMGNRRRARSRAPVASTAPDVASVSPRPPRPASPTTESAATPGSATRSAKDAADTGTRVPAGTSSGAGRSSPA